MTSSSFAKTNCSDSKKNEKPSSKKCTSDNRSDAHVDLELGFGEDKQKPRCDRFKTKKMCLVACIFFVVSVILVGFIIYFCSECESQAAVSRQPRGYRLLRDQASRNRHNNKNATTGGREGCFALFTECVECWNHLLRKKTSLQENDPAAETDEHNLLCGKTALQENEPATETNDHEHERAEKERGENKKRRRKAAEKEREDNEKRRRDAAEKEREDNETRRREEEQENKRMDEQKRREEEENKRMDERWRQEQEEKERKRKKEECEKAKREEAIAMEKVMLAARARGFDSTSGFAASCRDMESMQLRPKPLAEVVWSKGRPLVYATCSPQSSRSGRHATTSRAGSLWQLASGDA